MLSQRYGQHGTSDPHGPVWGSVLIGGQSRRMGHPKHLLEQDGITWLELILSKLQQRTDKIVISGKGRIPVVLQSVEVVPDISGLHGPLAGILSLFRAYPEVSWLIAACDMPGIETEALDWLLSFREKGVRAILPDLEGDGMVEPLLAYYDHSCLELLEEIFLEGDARPGRLVGRPGVLTPQPPVTLHSAWKNINLPEDLTG